MTHEEQRAHFGRRLTHRIVVEMGKAPDEATGWLAEAVGVRWQTAQFWLQGKYLPRGGKLAALGRAVQMNVRELIGEPVDEPESPEWRRFCATPEGRSMSVDERMALSMFDWPRPPSVGDYRGLLTLRRGNAERN